MKKLKSLSLFLVCITPSIAHSMRRVPCAHSRRRVMPSVTASAIKRCAPVIPRRMSVSVSHSPNQLQEINKRLYETRVKKIAARCKSIAWDASGVAIVLPTVAAYYFSGAGIFAALLSAPGLSPADCFDAQIPLLIMGAVHLASRKALCAEEKLCDLIEKKCDVHDKEVTETRNLIDELQSQRKALSDKKI